MDIETAYKFYTSVLDPQSAAKSEAKNILSLELLIVNQPR